MGTFALQIEEFAKKAGIRAETATRATALHMFNAIVSKTPVDTGQAKGSWTVGVYTLPSASAFKTGKDKTQKGEISGRNRTHIAKKCNEWGGEGSIYLASNVNHMIPLEYGPRRSKQAPQGMVRTTIADFQTSVAAGIAEAKKIK